MSFEHGWISDYHPLTLHRCTPTDVHTAFYNEDNAKTMPYVFDIIILECNLTKPLPESLRCLAEVPLH